MGNLVEQKEELEVLQSIFGDEVLITYDGASEGKIMAHPVLPQPFCIISHPQGGVKQEVPVKFLPPIVLHFRLPIGYPTTYSPAFVLSCEWLSRCQLLSLCGHLDVLWEECKPEVVLFRWVQFLQEDALAYLDIEHHLDISPLIVTAPSQVSFGNLTTALKRMIAAVEKYDVQNDQPDSTVQCQEAKSDPQKSAIRNFKSEIRSHLLKPNIERERDVYHRGRGRARGSIQKSPSTQIGSLHEKSSNGHVFSDEDVLKRLNIPALPQRQNSEEILCGPPLKDELDEDYRAAVTLKAGVNPLPIIVEYNEAKQKEKFDKDWFKCNVCLSEKVGNQCLQFLGCHHVYCKFCMQSYFEVQIKDGNVRLLTCPEDKCTSQATPSQVYELVGPELYSRYDSMLLESSLALMGDITYCPRTSCQFVVIKDNAEDMATCGRCHFVFCNFCRMTYHGVAPCKFRPDEKHRILDDYQNGSRETRLAIEKRYGKKYLATMLEESLSEKWMKDCTKKCPNCSASIQKSEGCNKMVCWRCNIIFCWLCMVKLNMNKPYLHFNDPKSRCYNLLFEGVEEDHEEWGFGEFL